MAGEEAGKEVVSLKRKKSEENEAGGMGWGARSSAAARINSIREKDPASNTDFGRFCSICIFFFLHFLRIIYQAVIKLLGSILTYVTSAVSI